MHQELSMHLHMEAPPIDLLVDHVPPPANLFAILELA